MVRSWSSDRFACVRARTNYYYYYDHCDHCYYYYYYHYDYHHC